MSLKFILPQRYMLYLSLPRGEIQVYRDGKLIHSIEAASCPPLVDYIKKDPRFPECWVYAHIEDNVLIVHSRIGGPND